MAEPGNIDLEIGNNENNTATIEDYFKLLKSEEVIPPDPNEKIPVGIITDKDSEYEKLIENGVTNEELQSRKIERNKLLKAGFVFNNQPIFPIEKPLINIELDGVNYGHRKLLTGEELAKIRNYQRTHPDLYGTENILSDEFRKDMLSLLLTTKDTLPGHIARKVNFFRLCVNEMGRSTSKKSDQKTYPLYKRLVDLNIENNQSTGNRLVDEKKFIEDNFKDIMPWNNPEGTPFDRFDIHSRGRKMMLIESRTGKLNDVPSPFLDSGFHFPRYIANPDFTVAGSNGKLFRVNSLVLHLASRGISEMGDGNGREGEQNYSIGNYIRDLYISDSIKRDQNREQEEAKFRLKLKFNQTELIKKVQERMTSVVQNWAMTDEAPPEAKQILNQIKIIEESQGKSWFAKLINRNKLS